MADATARAETAQALFCAIIDYVGLANIPDPLSSNGKNCTYLVGKTKYQGIGTYKCFLKWYSVKFRGKLTIAQIFKKAVRADATFKEVEELLCKDKNEWYLSSIRIAIKLLTDIKSIAKLSGWKDKNVDATGWQGVIYRRGDKEVMGTITELWSIANKGQQVFNAAGPKTKGMVFGDINKWNPADIYWSTPRGKRDLKIELINAKKLDGVYKFDDLNTATCKIIESGDLLPLSLKKNARGEIKIVLVNFDRKLEKNSVSTYSAGNLDPDTFADYVPQKLIKVDGKVPGKRKLVKTGKGGRRDFSLHILVNKQKKQGMRLKCRHDSAGSGPSKWLVQIFEAGKGESAGSLVGRKGMVIQMNLAGDKTADATWGKTFADAEKNFKAMVSKKTGSPPAGKSEKGLISEGWIDSGEGTSDGSAAYISMKDMYLKGKKHKTPQDNEWRDRYVLYAGNASGIHFANGPIAAFHKWLSEGMGPGAKYPGRTNRFIRNVYLYATSRSNTSGQFVIAK